MRPGTPGFMGQRLREAREARGFTATMLAESVGVTKQSVSLYESGAQTPAPHVMRKIVEVLRLPSHYFLARPPRSDETAIFWRSMASATKSARLRVERLYGWVREIADFLRGYVKAKDRRVGRSENSEDVSGNVNNSDTDPRGASQRLPNRCASYVGLLRGLTDDALHVRGRQRVCRSRDAAREREEARVNRSVHAADGRRDKLGRLRRKDWRSERARQTAERNRRGTWRVRVRHVQICETHAARDDVVATYEVGRLKAALRRDRNQLFERLVKVGRVFVESV